MAGINRLGKAPPKPGTLRPADPNRFKTQDFLSKDAEDDVEYLRQVHEVEETIMRQGYLSSRGAFDKGDLLYLRDQAEKQRHSELELRDAETTAFSRLSAQVSNDAEPLEGPPLKKPRPAKPKPVLKAAKTIPSSSTSKEPGKGQPTNKAPADGPSSKPPQTGGLLGLAYSTSSSDDEDHAGADKPAANGGGASSAPVTDEQHAKAKKAAALASLKALPGADELLQDLDTVPDQPSSPVKAESADDSPHDASPSSGSDES